MSFQLAVFSSVPICAIVVPACRQLTLSEWLSMGCRNSARPALLAFLLKRRELGLSINSFIHCIMDNR